MTNKFLLVCDDCGVDRSTVTYEMLRTKEDLKHEMLMEFSAAINEYAAVFADDIIDWDEASLEDDRAGMWVDGNSLFNRHVNWWMVTVEGRYPLVRCDVLDGGGIEVKVLGNYDTLGQARAALDNEYEREVEHPTFYAGWDNEHCSNNGLNAELTVETMDAQVNLHILDTSYAEPRESFEYLG